MRYQEIIEGNKKRRRDYSPEEWKTVTTVRQRRHRLSELLSKNIKSARDRISARGYKINSQYTTSISKRISPLILDLILSNNKDKQRIHKAISTGIASTITDHSGYGLITKQVQDALIDMILVSVMNDFELYRQELSTLKII